MDKLILVIDDNDQKNVIDELVREADKKGICNLMYRQFNVGSPNEPGLLTAGKIDVNKVKSAYKERFRDNGLKFDMIVCDWDLSDDEIDGAELLRRMGTECFNPKTPRILYSSLLYEKLEEQLNKYDKENDSTKEPVIKYIASLINANYLAFVPREEMKAPVLAHLRDSENIDHILEDVMLRHPDFVMAVGHGHNLEGRTFAEVAKLIRTNAEVSYDFKRNIIQEVVQYLTEKQAKERL